MASASHFFTQNYILQTKKLGCQFKSSIDFLIICLYFLYFYITLPFFLGIKQGNIFNCFHSFLLHQPKKNFFFCNRLHPFLGYYCTGYLTKKFKFIYVYQISMNLNEKSLNFAKKILKHYPTITQEHSCQQNCKHQHPSAHQPFQHMHDHRKEREIYEKSTIEKLENMRYFKQLGNAKFKQKKYDEASYFYQKTIIYADYTFPELEAQTAEMELLVQQSNMNLAICLIKQNNWTKAAVNLNEALKGQNSEKNQKFRNLVFITRKKALYWLAKYEINQGNYQQSRKQIQILEQLNQQISTQEQVAELRKQVIQQMNKHSRAIQNISKKMLQ